mgnify:CR=1 FL=1
MIPGSKILLYGKGVFTTIAVHEAKPFFWEKHWKRLTENAARLGIDLSRYTEAEIRDAVHGAAAAELKTGRVRVSFFDESPAELWGEEVEREVSLSILTGRSHQRPANLGLTISPHRVNSTSPLAGIKSCNYLEPLMALQKAKELGFEEGIRLNERGEVASACVANVFWVKDERLFTPSLRTGCLAGTTREYILENLACEEVEAGIEALQEADDIFLTSAGIGAMQAAEFEGRPLKRADHPVIRLRPF